VLLAAGHEHSLEAELEQALHASLDRFAVNRSMGAWVGVRTADWTLATSSGYSDVAAQTLAKATDIIPAGSVTKSFTAAYVMALVDRGDMQLVDKLYPLVDTFLHRLNGTTLLQLWGNDLTIQTVTLGDVLHMRSGIIDYNDSLIWDISMERPHYDIPPEEFLHIVNKVDDRR
jgi:CubicO group peptidase (beta-lactamase class C family)